MFLVPLAYSSLYASSISVFQSNGRNFLLLVVACVACVFLHRNNKKGEPNMESFRKMRHFL